MKTKKIIRNYSELITYKNFSDRFEYLKLDGSIGLETFGWDRYLNQMFYRNRDWRSVRDKVIIRDNGCDLGVNGYDILGEPILVHHMNPITSYDIENLTDYLLNPEYLISTRKSTHTAIHYGTDPMSNTITERTSNDTCPWKKER